MTTPDVLTIPQAARRLGKAPHTLRRLIAAGEFPVPVVTFGTRSYIGVRVLDAYINGSTSATPAAPSLASADGVEGAAGIGAVGPSCHSISGYPEVEAGG